MDTAEVSEEKGCLRIRVKASGNVRARGLPTPEVTPDKVWKIWALAFEEVIGADNDSALKLSAFVVRTAAAEG